MKQSDTPRSGELVLVKNPYNWHSCLPDRCDVLNGSSVPDGPALFLHWDYRGRGPVLVRADGCTGVVWDMPVHQQESLYARTRETIER